ncbi:hypothetical protein GQ43DRAFT_78668 [Delitschia confertaspora ATCC 74209]|uniref:Uncharacterized protein n=1 Tax=Delitschia confertaspora ATCC 74209 TaxID=1513339 RepID=A0A9P4JNI7_9PLEO|nr:hypothetical protein GQ43DRAFT_78668 [Delitschia confertaspora ATCC 74209]
MQSCKDNVNGGHSPMKTDKSLYTMPPRNAANTTHLQAHPNTEPHTHETAKMKTPPPPPPLIDKETPNWTLDDLSPRPRNTASKREMKLLAAAPLNARRPDGRRGPEPICWHGNRAHRLSDHRRRGDTREERERKSVAPTKAGADAGTVGIRG